VERALASAVQESRIHEALQVMAEGRRRQIHAFLDASGGGSPIPRADDVPQHGEAHGMAERTELFREFLELRHRRQLF
jgi:hypothetical protein